MTGNERCNFRTYTEINEYKETEPASALADAGSASRGLFYSPIYIPIKSDVLFLFFFIMIFA